jgi:hypothetical protein
MANAREILVVAPGDPARWRVFAKSGKPDELERFRTFVEGLDRARDGILAFGTLSACSHFGDVARRAGLPAVFCASPQDCPSGSMSDLGAALDLVPRRDRARLVVSVRGCTTDQAGNARSAEVAFLDGFTGGCLSWVRWLPGVRACPADLRVELLDTPRAGLHLRVGVPVADSPRDPSGFRIHQPRFVSCAKIERDGIFVLAPCDPVEPLRPLDPAGSTGDAVEDGIVVLALLALGADAVDASSLLRGEGREHARMPHDYARRAA